MNWREEKKHQGKKEGRKLWRERREENVGWNVLAHTSGGSLRVQKIHKTNQIWNDPGYSEGGHNGNIWAFSHMLQHSRWCEKKREKKKQSRNGQNDVGNKSGWLEWSKLMLRMSPESTRMKQNNWEQTTTTTSIKEVCNAAKQLVEPTSPVLSLPSPKRPPLCGSISCFFFSPSDHREYVTTAVTAHDKVTCAPHRMG